MHIAEAPNWITDNALYSDKWIDDSVQLEFMASQLDYKRLNSLRRKAGQPLVTQGILHEIEIAITQQSEQEEITKILRACNAKSELLEKETSMLEELTTGRLRAKF